MGWGVYVLVLGRQWHQTFTESNLVVVGFMLRPEKCYLIVLAQTPLNVKEQDQDGFQDFASPRNVSPGLTCG